MHANPPRPSLVVKRMDGVKLWASASVKSVQRSLISSGVPDDAAGVSLTELDGSVVVAGVDTAVEVSAEDAVVVEADATVLVADRAEDDVLVSVRLARADEVEVK